MDTQHLASLQKYTAKWKMSWKGSRILGHLNEQCAPFMDPIAYAQLNQKSLAAVGTELGYDRPSEFILGLLQYRMKVLLEAFLNSHDLGLDTGVVGKSGFPKARIDTNTLLIYIDELNRLGLSNIVSMKTILVEMEQHPEELPLAIVADFIAAFYRQLPEWVNELQPQLTEYVLQSPPNLDREHYLLEDSEYRKPVVEMSEYIQNQLSWAFRGFYIHGSLATLDYVSGCSDLDTFAIVRSEVTSDSGRLLQLREQLIEVWKYIYRVDALQHHGVMLMAEQDTGFYCQAFFPFVILDYAQTVLQDGTIIFKERNTSFEQKHFFYQVVQFFRYHFYNKSSFRNIFELKHYLQTLLLLPALYYQSIGEFTYKKHSFPKVFKDFDVSDTTLINKCSEFRSLNLYSSVEMTNLIEQLYQQEDQLPSREWVERFHMQIHRIPSTSNQFGLLGDDFVYEMYQLSEKMYERALGIWEMREKTQLTNIEDLYGNSIRFIKLPQSYKIKDYNKALDTVYQWISQRTDVKFIQFGSVKHPGISDLDILIVVNNRENAHLLNDIPASWKQLDHDTKYLFYHEPPMIVTNNNRMLLSELYPVFDMESLNSDQNATSIPIKPNPNSNMYGLVEITCLFFFRDTVQALLTRIFDVRFLLLRLSGLKHSIKILNDLNISESKWMEFNLRVKELRGNWFDMPDGNRQSELISATEDGMYVQLDVINSLKKIVPNHVYSRALKEDSGEQKVYAVLDNQVFFISQWTPECCIKIIDDVFQSTGSFVFPLPAEFAVLIAYYASVNGILAKCLADRFIHCLDPNLIEASFDVETRREMIEKQLIDLNKMGLTWGALPHWGFNPQSEPSEKVVWHELVLQSKLLNNNEMNIVKYYDMYNKREEISARARKSIDLNKWDEAVITLNEFLKIQPLDAEFNYLLGFCLHNQQKDYDKVLALYSIALEYGFDPFWVRYNRGVLYKQLNKWNEAHTDIRLAFQLDPTHEVLRTLLLEIDDVISGSISKYIKEARNYIDQGDFDNSIRIIKEHCLSLYPNHAESHYLLAFSYHINRSNPSGALEHYTKAQQNGFDEFWVCYNRGALYRHLKEYTMALKDIKRAIELNENNKYMNNLVVCDIHADIEKEYSE
jgi:tetratricopeptide (TPR) repeat protein